MKLIEKLSQGFNIKNICATAIRAITFKEVK